MELGFDTPYSLNGTTKSKPKEGQSACTTNLSSALQDAALLFPDHPEEPKRDGGATKASASECGHMQQ